MQPLGVSYLQPLGASHATGRYSHSVCRKDYLAEKSVVNFNPGHKRTRRKQRKSTKDIPCRIEVKPCNFKKPAGFLTKNLQVSLNCKVTLRFSKYTFWLLRLRSLVAGVEIYDTSGRRFRQDSHFYIPSGCGVGSMGRTEWLRGAGGAPGVAPAVVASLALASCCFGLLFPQSTR